MDPHQPCEFHKSRIKTATYIVTSYTYIYISILTLRIRIRCLQNEKRDPHLPHASPSEVKSVRIFVISFRNIAKKNIFECLIYTGGLQVKFLPGILKRM